MNILLDLIDNPMGAGHNTDHRYSLWLDIGRALQERGHKVYGRQVNMRAKCPKEFIAYIDFLHQRHIDFYACHSPYGNAARQKLRQDLLTRRKYFGLGEMCHVVCFDHGWLYKSIVVDRKMLFSDSYYYHTIAQLIQENFDPLAADEYRLLLLNQNLSKRPQPNLDSIPEQEFIFIPAQVLYDASVVNYSKIGLLEFTDQVIEFAADHNIHVVFKPHPGMTDEPKHGKAIIENFCRERSATYPFFHVVRAPIYTLMQKAKFTACINSGSIIDNFTTQTAVYCCGRSFFSQSGTVIYDPDVKQGLEKMWEQDYDLEEIRINQLKLLWWLRCNLIQEEFSIEQNIRLLEYHSGVKF